MDKYHVDVNDKALEHFNLKRDPCNWLPEKATDYFFTTDMGFVDMVLWRAIELPGIAAIIGDVGCGKSSAVRRFVTEHLKNNNQYCFSVLNAPQMRHLDIGHILRKILYDMTGGKDQKLHNLGYVQTAEGVIDLIHNMAQQRKRPVLFIDDAHLLGKQPLHDLKGLYELREGIQVQHTLAIILVAQPQLRDKLDGNDSQQLAQRCRVHEMQGLKGDLTAYLKHRFKRANPKGDIANVFEPEALKALAAYASRRGEVTTPLEVHSWCARAMNRAWGAAQDRVSSEIMAAVVSETKDEGKGEVLTVSPAPETKQTVDGKKAVAA